MKLNTSSLAFLFLFFCSGLCAQDMLARLGGVAQGFANHDREYTGTTLGFESRISRHFTVGLDVDYFHSREALGGQPEVDDIRNVWNVQPEFRYYVSEALRGFFLGGHLSYNRFHYKYKIDEAPVEVPGNTGPSSLVALGFTLGYAHTIIGRLKLGINAGGDYFFNPGRYGDGAKFRLAVNLGYGF